MPGIGESPRETYKWTNVETRKMDNNMHQEFVCFSTLRPSELCQGVWMNLTLSSRRMKKRGKVHCSVIQRRWTCSGRSLTRSAPAAPMSAACCMVHVAWICLDQTVMTLS